MKSGDLFYSEYLQELAGEHHIPLTRKESSQLVSYMSDILEENQNINLTAIQDPYDFLEKHIIDSILCLSMIDKEEAKLIDVGTGGGFPGVPIAIMKPYFEVDLLDSTAKKLKVVEKLIKENEIRNVTCIRSRAEEASKFPAFREKFDYAISRGVASLITLAELCLPFVKVGGYFIALKSQNYELELKQAEEMIDLLGGRIAEVEKKILKPSHAERVLIKIEKISRTPTRFPRPFAQIKKEADRFKNNE